MQEATACSAFPKIIYFMVNVIGRKDGYKVTINVAAIYHKMFLFPWQQCMSKCIQMATTIIMFRILGNYYSFSRDELKRFTTDYR